MPQKKNPHWKIIMEAMLKGEVVNRLWAAKQFPIIAQPGNRCNELLRKGIPVQKIMVYENNTKHMDFFLKKDYIQSVKDKLISVKVSPI
jgi:hypothetical protein